MTITAKDVAYSVDWLVNVSDMGMLDGFRLFRAFDLELNESCWVRVDSANLIYVSYCMDPKTDGWAFVGAVAA